MLVDMPRERRGAAGATATLPGPSRTITVEPLTVPREEPAPAPEPAAPPEREPVPDREREPQKV